MLIPILVALVALVALVFVLRRLRKPTLPPQRSQTPPTPPTLAEDEESPADEYDFFSLQNLRVAGVGLAVAAALVLVIAVALFFVFEAISVPGEQLPPELRLDPELEDQYTQLHATQAAQLENYGWYNQDAGVAQIPIERAMQIVAEKGTGEVAANLPVGVPAAQASGPGGAASPGAQLFQQQGCVGCHQQQDTATAPTLVGLFGHQVQLQDGSTVTADEAYIHESIVDPNAKIVAGYQPIMPSFADRLSEDQINQLIDYIKSLSGSGS